MRTIGRQWKFAKKGIMKETIPFLRELWEEEQNEGKSLTAWVEEIGEYCGVGKSAVWSWYTGTRTPSAAARKLLKLRRVLPPQVVRAIEKM